MNYGAKVLIRGDCKDYSVHEITNNFYVGKIITVKSQNINGDYFKVLEDKDGYHWCRDMIDKLIICKG